MAATTLDPTHVGPNMVLSNGNLTVSQTSHASWNVVRGTNSQSSGKWYFEVTIDTTFAGSDQPIAIGVCNGSQSFADTHNAGDSQNGTSNFCGGNYYFNGVLRTGKGAVFNTNAAVIGVAVDADNGVLYCYNPTGTLYWADPNQWVSQITGWPTAIYPAISMNTVGGPGGSPSCQVTCNFGASAFSHTIPSGFTAWDGTAVAQPVTQFIDPRVSHSLTISGAYNSVATAVGNNWCQAQTCGWQSTGKYYCEFTLTNLGGGAGGQQNIGIGIACPRDLTNPLSGVESPYLGKSTLSCGYFINNGAVYINAATSTTYATGTTNDVFGMAADFTNSKLWWQKNGGNWNNDVIGNQNPANNTGGFSISTLTGNVYAPAVSLIKSTTAAVVTCNFGATSFTTSPPTGFSAWRGNVATHPFGTIIG